MLIDIFAAAAAAAPAFDPEAATRAYLDTLQGAGPFTVFAPTNSAFAALPAGTVDMLLKPESKATLTFRLFRPVGQEAVEIAAPPAQP